MAVRGYGHLKCQLASLGVSTMVLLADDGHVVAVVIAHQTTIRIGVSDMRDISRRASSAADIGAE